MIGVVQMKISMNVEYSGNKTDCKLLLDKVKGLWKEDGRRVKDLESLEIYFKPEDGACYYVINGSTSGSFNTKVL